MDTDDIQDIIEYIEAKLKQFNLNTRDAWGNIANMWNDLNREEA